MIPYGATTVFIQDHAGIWIKIKEERNHCVYQKTRDVFLLNEFIQLPTKHKTIALAEVMETRGKWIPCKLNSQTKGNNDQTMHMQT